MNRWLRSGSRPGVLISSAFTWRPPVTRWLVSDCTPPAGYPVLWRGRDRPRYLVTVGFIYTRRGFHCAIQQTPRQWVHYGVCLPNACAPGLNQSRRAASVVAMRELYLLDSHQRVFEHDAVGGDEVGDDAGEEHLETGKQ